MCKKKQLRSIAFLNKSKIPVLAEIRSWIISKFFKGFSVILAVIKTPFLPLSILLFFTYLQTLGIF